jgi:hypothetical protein
MAKKQPKADDLAKKDRKYPSTKVIQAKRDTKGRKMPKKDESQWGDENDKKYMLRCDKESEAASTERRSAWRELWFLYQNKQGTKNKKSWQSKCFAPKIWMKVERAAATIKRGLMQVSKLFKLELDDTEGLEKDAIEQLEDEGKRVEKKFKRKLAKTNFSNIISEMVKCEILLGLGVPKILWGKDKATFENIDILNIQVDPNYKPFQEEPPKYIIEHKQMDLAELRLLAEQTNEAAGESVFNMTEINKIEEDFKKLEKDGLRQQRLGMTQHSPVSKQVSIMEFWGDIISEDGKEIKKNQVRVLANKKYMIRKQDNPFNHKRPPYILSYAMVYPHRGMAGVSLVEPSAKLQYTYNNILNSYVDNLNFSVNKMFEYTPLALHNPKDILTVFPGKLFQTKGGQQAVREITTSNIGKEAIDALQTVAREMDEGTSVTEFLTGTTSKKPKTLGEIEIKTGQSEGFFDVIARDLEQNSIKPILEMTYSLYSQFGDMPDIEGVYQFKVGGLSLLVKQKEQEERLQRIMVMAQKFPDLHQRTDIDDLWKAQMVEHQAEMAAKAKVAEIERRNPQALLKLAG